MTSTDPTTNSAQPTGVDLARVALNAARAAAQRQGTETTVQRRPRRSTIIHTRTGREPLSLGTTIERMLAERGYTTPAAGGTICDQWPDIAATIAPTLARHTTATAFDPDSGRLDLRATSTAYATQARLMAGPLTNAANHHAGRTLVKTIRVLNPNARAIDPTQVEARPAPAPRGPVRTRETASTGYREALAAHQAHHPQLTDPAIKAAAERQHLDAAREPEDKFRPAQEAAAAASAHQQAARTKHPDAVRAEAILKARKDRAARTALASVNALTGQRVDR
ncbi:DciA family protein [Streptomyces diastaticus]|uniref:DciA family protein n=1 Tax=Streptomyces diastaticus TaxID=1956 RepID=UPI00365592EB